MPDDDSLMNRFDRNGLRRFRARDGIIALLVCGFLLIVFAGAGIRRQGERMDPGWDRDVVLAIGNAAVAIAYKRGFEKHADDATAFLSPDDRLGGAGGFEAVAAQAPGGAGGAPGTPRAFDPARA